MVHLDQKVALGMAAKVEAALDAQIKAADDDMDSIEASAFATRLQVHALIMRLPRYFERRGFNRWQKTLS